MITKASKSTNAGFKRKKIKSMKREADKITEKLRESEKALKLIEPRVPKDPISGALLKQHPLNRNKCIEVNAGINLTGYHPPQAPQGFCTEMCAQPQGFCTTENAWGLGQ